MDYRGQIRALHEDKYDGVIALETHCTSANGSKIDGTKESLDGLMNIINSVIGYE